MSRIAVALLCVFACSAPDRLEHTVAARFRARGPTPVSTSSDGARVLVELPHDQAFTLRVIDRATGTVLAQRRDDERAIAPAWRGDGGALAYFRAQNRRRAYELRIWTIADGRDTAVGVPATATAFARFAPDGRRLAYLATDRGRHRMLVVVDLDDTRRTRTLVEVAERAELAWSPDGTRIATATASDPGALTVVDLDGGSVQVPVVDGELRDLAWSPDRAVVAVSARGSRDEYLGLFRIDLASRTAAVAQRPPGDVHAPRFIDHALAYHVERDGERSIHIDGRRIGRRDASASLAGVNTSTQTAIVVYRPRTRAAYVAAVPLMAPSTDFAEPGDAAIRIDTVARDGVRLPAYVWKARGRTLGAVVIVHGGPALHASPAWNEKIQFLVEAGYDVVKLDYRGSTGHGASFERLGAPDALSSRVDDVLAARDHVASSTGLRADQIVLLGESYGAGLVAAATVRDGSSPAVLVSTMPLAAELPRGPGATVVAFHGADDDLAAPAVSREYLARRFGSALRWTLLPREGHNLARTESWAAVYTSIVRILQRCNDRVLHRCSDRR